MFKRSNHWSYTKEEKKKIKDCILPLCKKWREKENDNTVDYVMVQPSEIIVHNGKGAINNSRFINKLNFCVYSDGHLRTSRNTVRTDELYLNRDFINEIKTALEKLK